MNNLEKFLASIGVVGALALPATNAKAVSVLDFNNEAVKSQVVGQTSANVNLGEGLVAHVYSSAPIGYNTMNQMLGGGGVGPGDGDVEQNEVFGVSFNKSVKLSDVTINDLYANLREAGTITFYEFGGSRKFVYNFNANASQLFPVTSGRYSINPSESILNGLEWKDKIGQVEFSAIGGDNHTVTSLTPILPAVPESQTILGLAIGAGVIGGVTYKRWNDKGKKE